MESFFRYISYIDLYDKHNKIKNAGFLRWKFQNGIHSLEIQVQNANNLSGTFKIREKRSDKLIGDLILDQGMGSYFKSYSTSSSFDDFYLNTENFQISLYEIDSFYVELNNNYSLVVPISLPIKKPENLSAFPDSEETSTIQTEVPSKEVNVIASNQEESVISTENTLPLKIIENTPDSVSVNSDSKKINYAEHLKIIEPLHEDKWQQLLKKYSQVHPFSNNVTFLSIKPEDFIIFQKEYQKLVNNSFLLHGFYNYGHLILGKLQDDETAPFYLGVPGVYYDREKQAAQMFGFIGFESTEQPVQSGSYGYYMIEVMI